VPLLEAAHKLHDSTQQGPTPAAAHRSQPLASISIDNSPSAGDHSTAAAAAASGVSEAGLPDGNSKLLALFELWDKAGDGRVTFQELCLGLAKFTPVKSKQVHSGEPHRRTYMCGCWFEAVLSSCAWDWPSFSQSRASRCGQVHHPCMCR
jgi:hypothetical protein